MVQVGNVTIGNGMPKICASITETSQKAIIAAADILCQKSIDILEWRIDFYQQVDQWDAVSETLHRLRMSIGKKPLLITFRTKEEGGNKTISWEEYKTLLLNLANTKKVDMLDVQIFSNAPYNKAEEAEITDTKEFISKLKKNAVIVGSYHNFDETPSYDEMKERLLLMHEFGADIPKMAVMPKSKGDVLRLMSVTLDVDEQLKNVPLITMSMGGLGSISRVSGESFNSAVTFGCVGTPSAPGQMSVDHLADALELIHQSYR